LPPDGSFAGYSGIQFIGEGGMAKVYKAFDPKLNRPVALKFIRTPDRELSRRLLREARAQARIHHEHVCRIYAAQEEGAGYCIVMQYIPGHSLKELKDSLSLQEKVKILQQVAEGVQAAHTAGVIHRDLKPGNIMVEKKAAD